MEVNEFILEIASKFSSNPFLKFLLRPPYSLYKYIFVEASGRKEKKRFDKIGLELITKFDECLSKNGFRYSLAFGSLLGAIREKGFVKHDDDLDVWMWIDDYRPELIDNLKEYGFNLKYSFSIDDDKHGKEDTFEYKGALIDIFYLYESDNGEKYSCIFNIFPDSISRKDSIKKHGGLLPVKCILPVSRDFERVPFESINLPVPVNALEVLKCRYGEDFMIPQPKWNKARKDQYHVIWQGKIGKYKEYK